ncbi:hypothetical protein [Flammeovirga pacifica]|nr:hypothetical protein [Flammeovirga pacifica]
MEQTNIQLLLFNAIKNRDLKEIHQTLDQYLNDTDIEDRLFWVERYDAILKELEKKAATYPEEELFWLDIMRAFIDVVPR